MGTELLYRLFGCLGIANIVNALVESSGNDLNNWDFLTVLAGIWLILSWVSALAKRTTDSINSN